MSEKKNQEVSVNAKFRIKVGDVELEMSKEDAEKLYSALFMALGKSLITYPVYIEKIVDKWPWYTTPNPIWKYEPNTIYCCNNPEWKTQSYYSDINIGVEVTN
jgi:hypothetical protein